MGAAHQQRNEPGDRGHSPLGARCLGVAQDHCGGALLLLLHPPGFRRAPRAWFQAVETTKMCEESHSNVGLDCNLWHYSVVTEWTGALPATLSATFIIGHHSGAAPEPNDTTSPKRTGLRKAGSDMIFFPDGSLR